jgi:glycerol uptake facilitator-like aquaporin
MRNKLLVEAVGTFFLCLAVMLSGNPLSVAALLCALLYMGAPVSLPHYNPAVTLAFRLRGRIGTRALGAYVGVQLLAAIAAALVAGALLGDDIDHAKSAVDALGEPAFKGFWRSATVEMLGAFLLALVTLTVGTSRLIAGNSYFGVAIALAWLGLSSAFSAFNPNFNPAPTISYWHIGTWAALSEGLEGAKAFVTQIFFLAKFAPRIAADVGVQFLGAALAAWFFRYLFPEDR